MELKVPIKGVFIILTLVLMLAFQPKAGLTQVGGNNEDIAVILVIDISGSMRTTDPFKLRETAANIFIDLLGPNDYLGIIAFDHNADVIIPLQKVESPNNKELIKRSLYNKLEARGNTDYIPALLEAKRQLKDLNLANHSPYILLLTDGDPNPKAGSRDNRAFMEAYMERLWKEIEAFAYEGLPIYTVGLGSIVNPEIIENISEITRGITFRAESPTDLPKIFFDMLSGIKSRINLFNETFTLRGETKEFSFFLDKYIKQVNITVYGQRISDFDLWLENPLGIGPAEGLTYIKEPSYGMLILHSPPSEYSGDWILKIRGSGTFNLMTNMDFSIKPWIIEPLHQGKYPLNESQEVVVRLDGEDLLGDKNLRVEGHIKIPGQIRPYIIPLEKKDGFFRGIIRNITSKGTYQLDVKVYAEDELVSYASIQLFFEPIPRLIADTFHNKFYFIGEEILITSSLISAGNRMPEGKDLVINEYEIVLLREDGAKIKFPLNDEGESGDVRKGDGIWTSRVVLDNLGRFNAAILIDGIYKDNPFTINKNLGSFEVFPLGSVMVEFWKGSNFLTLPGRLTTIPLKISNYSNTQETIRFELDKKIGYLGKSTFTLEPLTAQLVNLELISWKDLVIEEYSIPISFTLVNSSSELINNEVIAQIRVISMAEFLKLKGASIAEEFWWLGVLVLIILIIWLLMIILGWLLYRFRISSKLKLNGIIYYSTSNKEFGFDSQMVNLSKGKITSFIISFNKKNDKADLILPSDEYSFDIIIENHWDYFDKKRSKYKEGLKALFNPPTITTFCKPILNF